MNINDLIEIEKSGDVLKYHFEYKNKMIWPYIRYFVLRSVNEISNKREPFKLKKTEKGVRWKDWIVNNPFMQNKKRILIMGISKDLGVRDKYGRYYNRSTIYYEKIFPEDTLVLENGKYEERDYLLNKIYTNSIIEAIANFLSKSQKASLKDMNEINKIIVYLKKVLPANITPKFYQDLKRNMIFIATHLNGYEKAYTLLFKKIRPSIVILNCASYGGLINATIMKVCKELKIPSAEIQHGTIAGNFEPTNYAERVRNNLEYKQYLPDYYLLFGDYWKQFICADITPVVIGNPLFSKAFRGRSDKERQREVILWVSTGEHNQCKSIVANFLKMQNKYKVCLKLHPLEDMNEVKKTYKELEKNKNFIILQKGNIYSYLKHSDIVIGSGTTVIYEAEAMGNRVLIADNGAARAYTPSDVGEWFKDEKELLELLASTKKKENSGKQYYNINWEKNYESFVKELVADI